MRISVVLAALLATGRAFAQPEPVAKASEPPAEPLPESAPVETSVPEPPPTPTPTPTATAPPVFALDGEARNYEQAPEDSSVSGSGVLRGLRTGLGYVVRVLVLPLRGLVYLEARWHIVSQWPLANDARTLGIIPVVAFTSDFGLHVGAKAFIDNHFGYGEDISFTAGTGGTVKQGYQLKAEVDHIGSAPIYVWSRLRYEDNDGLIFAGIGNDSGEITRFSQKRFLAVLSSGVYLSKEPRLRIGANGIFNDRSFGEGGDSLSEPSIEMAYDTSMVRGFDDGIRTLELTAEIALDTRDTRGPTQHGGLVRAFAGPGSPSGEGEYFHYGIEGAYFLTPWWPRRTFVGRLVLDGVVDGDDDIPFTELPRLGGEVLRGFHRDQFRDKLATIATLEYHWPFHANFSGAVFVETGTVGRTYSDLAELELHSGVGGGIMFHTSRRTRARIDVAWGDGFQIYFTTDIIDAFRKREREL